MSSQIDQLFTNQNYFLAFFILLIILYFFLYNKIKKAFETRYIKNDINPGLILTLVLIVILIAGMSIYYESIFKEISFKYTHSVMNKDLLEDEVNYYKKELERTADSKDKLTKSKEEFENIYIHTRDTLTACPW